MGNLIFFGDCNNNQSGVRLQSQFLYPTADKWRNFHWHVQTIDGHNIDSIKEAIANAKAVKDKPSYIECKTVKGKNIPYMENNNAWHKKTRTQKRSKLKRSFLKGGM